MRTASRLLLVLVAAACTPDGAHTAGDTTTTPAVGSSVQAQSTNAPTEASAFEGTTGRSAGGSRDIVATLDAVRTAAHDGYVRVVFTLREGVPAYVVEYAAQRPSHCGSGEPADVAGAAYLVVRMSGTNAHEFDGERARSTVPERNIRVDGPVLRQLLLTCDFEAEVSWVLGLDRQRPYRVMALRNPPRVVVDVSTEP